ncbi:hypothetical protein D0862_05659 [Hortaea werneckii]|uniref:Uncharacterized protein n=1 Tax=Hortaea werneckii TaxID=91943 RepID=A0A3M7GRB1_HORWE|nr:hypothetical protein D0862_05659 [Hortaea werneckii]
MGFEQTVMANIAIAKPASTTDTQYHSLSSISDTEQQPGKDASLLEPKLELGDHPPLQKSRSWLKTILLQTLCLLWTVPIMALLVLNFKRHIIGASAWCPNKDCWVQGFSVNTSTTVSRITKFDRQDHNLLGALQFVAKGLEIWFELIATALVYLVTMLLASKKDGLPIGYLTRPNEFADVTGLFDRLLWTSLPMRRHNEPYKRWSRIRIWAFIAMTIVLCALCNLMGPATAVLVIPSLQWIETERVSTGTFSHLNSANPPSTSALYPIAIDDTFQPCNESDFASYNYTCASYDWAEKLDAWVSSIVASAAEYSYRAITWQDVLSFTVNTTSSKSKIKGETVFNNDPITWIPNRNLIKAFYKDATVVAYISQGYSNTEISETSQENDIVPVEITDEEYETYRLYNKSLELELQRSGPILGTYPNYFSWSYTQDDESTYWWTVVIDSDHALRCCAGYVYGNVDTDYYTRCFQDGAGWGPNTKYTNFSIAAVLNSESQQIEPGVKYEVYSSDKVGFLHKGQTPPSLPQACLNPGQVSKDLDCDWDALFAEPGPSPRIKNNVTTLVMTMITANNTTAVLAVDFVAFAAFTNYTLDPSPLSNPISLVQTQTVPQIYEPVALNPAWTLAAWTTEVGGKIPAERTAATILRSVMTTIASSNATLLMENRYLDQLLAVVTTPIFQTLSMIEYETLSPTSLPTTTGSSRPQNPSSPSSSPLTLTRNANLHVWAYGLTSRTSLLGAVVSISGIITVLIQFLLGLVDRKDYRSPTQLLVAALEHFPQGEFEQVLAKGSGGGGCADEGEVARTRFCVREVERGTGVGRLGFRGLSGRV